jgi:hypothetical protein
MGIGCDGRAGLEFGFDGGGTALHGILRGVWGPGTVRPKGDSSRPRDRAEKLLPGHRMQDISSAQNSVAWNTSIERAHDVIRTELILAFFACLNFLLHFCLMKTEIRLFYTC